MAPQFTLGQEIEGWCTKCREMHLHYVVSLGKNEKPARTRCKVCDGEHNYRPNPPQSRRSSSASTTKKKAGLVLSEEQKSAAVPYTIDASFKEGDVISHPTLGFGAVTEVRSPQRMVVEFDSSQKLLIHNTQLSS